MGLFRFIMDRKASSNPDFRPVRSPVFERLEPRIMLSGDGLLSCLNSPGPLQDSLLEDAPQIVQYSEMLDTDSLYEGQNSLELTSPDTINSDVYEPIITLYHDEIQNFDSLNANLNNDIDNSTQVSTETSTLPIGSDVAIALILGTNLFEDSDVQPIERGADSTCLESSQQQLIIEELTETLRVPHGPPGAESVLASLEDIQLEYIDTSGPLDLVVRLNTQDSNVIEVFDNNTGNLLSSYTLSEINSLIVIGSDNSNDTLTIDMSNMFSIPGGVIFSGGNGGYDKLVLIGKSELTAEYFGDGNNEGAVIVYGEEGSLVNVSYSGLEPFVYLNEFGTIRNSGIFNYGNSPEILDVDNFSQNSGDTLIIEIGGLTPGAGGYDQVNVTNTAILNGTLEIQLINDFSPSLGQNFEIMTYGSAVGDFTTFIGYNLGEGLYLAPVKTQKTYRLDVVNYDPFAADAPQNLNVVIDNLLATHFDPIVDPIPSGSFVFTSNDGDIPNIITVGGMDLHLENVELTFSNLEFIDGNWTGQVVVKAEMASLYPDMLGIDVDDSDDYAVEGIIYLAAGNNSSFLSLDDLEEEDIGWPSFIDLDITDLRLEFPDFRMNDAENDLSLTATFIGLDTGNAYFNGLLSTSGVFAIEVTGSVTGLKLDMDAIRQGIRDLASGKINFPSSPIVGLGNDVSISGQITGKLFKIGVISGGFILKKTTYDPDDSGPEPEQSAIYLAWTGQFIMANEAWGGRNLILEAAFAISTRGFLQFYFALGTSTLLEPTTGLTLEEAHLGVRFYTTIEGMQIDTDFRTNNVQVNPDISGSGYRITLTFEDGHDFEPGDYLRIKNPQNPDNTFYNDDFEVLTVNDNQVTYWVENDPGDFVGDAEIIRLTIKDPLDLLDTGLQSIAPPGSIADWETQLDGAVKNQLKDSSVLDSWAGLFDNVVFGGGATLSINPIPDSFMKYKVDFMIDTDFRILLNGEMWLLNGVVKNRTRLYADLSELRHNPEARFLYLQTQYETSNFEIDPLLVYRGKVSFETLSGSGILGASVTENNAEGFWEIELELNLDNPSNEYEVGNNAVIYGSDPGTFNGTYEVIAIDDSNNTITIKSLTNPGTWVSGGKVTNENALIGFRIVLEGGVDLNIPGIEVSPEPPYVTPITVTTLTLEGEVWIEFKLGTDSDPEVKAKIELSLGFEVTLSESNFINGEIAWADGLFQLSVIVKNDNPLTPDVNEDGDVKLIIFGAARLASDFDFLEYVGLYMNVGGFLRINSSDQNRSIELPDGLEVDLPAYSFALRLEGSVDFRISGVSVFEIDGIFVLEFSTGGFNAAIFSINETTDEVEAAFLRLGPEFGPNGESFIEFRVFAFLAIRDNGFAAHLAMSTEYNLLGLASINAAAVLIVNTTGQEVSFDIPGGATDPNGPTDLSLVIPGARPNNPGEILAEPKPGGQPGLIRFEDLVNGDTWDEQHSGPAGAYGIVFVDGSLSLLSLLGLDVSGYILLSEEVMSLKLNFYAGMNLLGLANAHAYGTVFFSSQGEFEVEIHADVQLGPDGFNISGTGDLTISYLDSDDTGSEGDGNKILKVKGNLDVDGEIFWVHFKIATLKVQYNSDTGVIFARVGVRILFWMKYWNFTIGTLKVVEQPAPQVELGWINEENGDRELTLNVGPDAGARNLCEDEPNEDVLIEYVSAGSERGEKIRITMFGYSQTFDNITEILIRDMADGEDYVAIGEGVAVPVEIHFGDDNDNLVSAGCGIVTAYGDAGNDLLIGGENDDIMYGGAGNDRIVGDLADINVEEEVVDDETHYIIIFETIGSVLGGNDIIDGDDGDDIILGGSGNDIIYGGAGEDLLIGDDGTVIVSAVMVDDSIIPISISFTLTDLDFSGDDIIDGGADNDTLYGQKGKDILLGGTGNDELYGYADAFGTETTGNILLGDSGIITIVDGIMTIDTRTESTGGTDTIHGNGGADIAMGGADHDDIYGYAGNDILLGDTGIIMLENGQLVYLDSENEETGNSDTIQGGIGDDIIIGGVNGSSDTLYGDAGNDIILGDNGFIDYSIDDDLSTLDLIRSAIDGLGGSDFIYGNEGDDVLIGGTGGDRIDGNDGKDLILGDNGVLTYINGNTSTPRFRVLEGNVMYGETPDDDGLLLIDLNYQFNDPAGIPQWAVWEVMLNADSGGPDYIAGGQDDDQIFGQSGNDIIQGDGSIGTIDTPTAVNAYRNVDGLLVVSASIEDSDDGDDYIEGNDGDDIIFGNLGQDDIIGGSSGLFGLDTSIERTDGQDMIFGGAGTDLARNDQGDTSDNGHARDADVILGDNGNIYRLVGTNGTDCGNFLVFNYDNYGTEKIILRGVELLDYTPGGLDYDGISAANDRGASDEIHGESGDDFLYGMVGNDVIFGEGQDDDIIGGYGNDWISGGTGDDGILGDDGRIYTSRNGTPEPLYGIDDLAGELDKYINTPDKKQQATINVSGELKKTVNLTPFKLGDPEVLQYLDDFDPLYADDIIFGGLGNDSLHGGDGDDAISGAEALAEYYDNPINPGDILKFGVYRDGEFGAYNNDDPLSKVCWNPETGEFVINGTVEFLLNFNHTEGPMVNDVNTDGDDVIFGDMGNDWLVGGTGRDHIYGGRGSDLLNADDNLDTAGCANNEPDGSETSYEDIAYGGAGQDVLIANISSDRLIDWIGNFNRYVLPYNSFGAETISRNIKPKLFEFLYDLSKSDGADKTLGYSKDLRNGEPDGELGLVTSKDPDWENQMETSEITV